jgi:hypothetical protein
MRFIFVDIASLYNMPAMEVISLVRWVYLASQKENVSERPAS